jgi:hypothetical protein
VISAAATSSAGLGRAKPARISSSVEISGAA